MGRRGRVKQAGRKSVVFCRFLRFELKVQIGKNVDFRPTPEKAHFAIFARGSGGPKWL